MPASSPPDPGRGENAVRFTRITVRPGQMGGLPCIRGLRIPVASVVDMLADGMSQSEIVAAHPDLEVEDVREAIGYAAEAVRNRNFALDGNFERLDPNSHPISDLAVRVHRTAELPEGELIDDEALVNRLLDP